MTLIWFIVWLISDLSGDREALTFDPVNAWAATLILAIALDHERRASALESLIAPDVTLRDLDGTPHSLSQWRGRKRLLHAFSSW